MIQELSGGEVLSGQVTYGELDVAPLPVETSLDYVNTRLGTDLGFDEIEQVFKQLEFAMTRLDNGRFVVDVPRRRWDISIQADLVEEIARIYGYDRLPTTLPDASGTAGELTSMQALKRRVRHLAEGTGLSEIISYTLTTLEKAVEFSPNPSQQTELMWPMSIERSALRQNMVAGMLDTLAYNSARKHKNLAFYEIGKIFKQDENPKVDLPEEIDTFAIALSGLVHEKDFQTQATPVDFYYLKGILEAIFDKLGVVATYTAYQGLSSMHPGRTALISIQDHVIGYLGQVHPQTAKDYDVAETYVAEVNLSLLLTLLPQDQIFKEITKYPAVTRDIALLVDKTISHQAIHDVILGAGVKRLTNIALFDVYQGPNILTHKKSMAYSLTFQNPEDNLTDEEVASYMAKIEKALVETCGAEVR